VRMGEEPLTLLETDWLLRAPTHSDADPAWPRRALRALVVITLVGFALRLGWLLMAQPAAVSDALGYKSLAERWVTEGTYERYGQPTAWRTPGYIGFLGLGILASDSELWLGYLNVIAASTVVPLVAVLTRRLGLPVLAAVTASALAAVMPAMVLWAPVLGPENLQTPLLLAGVVLAADPRRTTRTAVASGLMLGLAILVRPESLVYLPIIPLAMWRGDWWVFLRRTMVVSVLAIAVCVPWLVRNQIQVGPVGLSSVGGVNFYLAHRDDGYGFQHYNTTALAGLDEVEMSRRGYELGRASLAEQPLRLFGDVAEGTRELYGPPRYAPFFSSRDFSAAAPYPLGVSPELIGVVRAYNLAAWYTIAVLAVLGWCALVVRRHRAALVLTGMAVANWLCFAVVFWALPRYRFPLEPFLCIAAAVPLTLLARRGGARFRRGGATHPATASAQSGSSSSSRLPNGSSAYTRS
jgi:Dolichyl-phosphate-mannose-protein mannosyltransferase